MSIKFSEILNEASTKYMYCVYVDNIELNPGANVNVLSVFTSESKAKSFLKELKTNFSKAKFGIEEIEVDGNPSHYMDLDESFLNEARIPKYLYSMKEVDMYFENDRETFSKLYNGKNGNSPKLVTSDDGVKYTVSFENETASTGWRFKITRAK